MLNRQTLFQSITSQIAHCRAQNLTLGVLLLRVQRLNEFNIVFGYEAGDQLLAAARQRIAEALRVVDIVYHAGECDFFLLLPGLQNPNHAVLAASRLIRAFHEPLTVADRRVRGSIAVGACAYPEHGSGPDVLCRRAEVALNDGMRSSDRFALYTATSGQETIPFDALRDAISHNRLALHLQGITDIRRNRLVGVEALARWHSESLGWVSPSLFIPFAEDTGLISPLTRWSINNAMRHCGSAWRSGHELAFAINLSPRVFSERGIVEQMVGAARVWDVATSAVIIEVTENALMEDPALSSRVLERLQRAGFNIAIDDFGTGYSSFTYLKHFTATELKIDKSFVFDMLHDERTAQLVRSMIDLAHHLGMRVVAEGVENPATLEQLREMGCDYAQGFHFSIPQPAETFLAGLNATAGAANEL